MISLPRRYALEVPVIVRKSTVAMRTQMPAPRQIVSLVTFFEISQRKSLGCRASPAVLSLHGFSEIKVKTDSSLTVRVRGTPHLTRKKQLKNVIYRMTI